MEEVCLPAGRAADEAMGAAAGLRYDDVQLPMLMRAMYGARMPKFVFVLREPCDRLWSAYKGTPALNQREEEADLTGCGRRARARHRSISGEAGMSLRNGSKANDRVDQKEE
eukprot:356660-Chlamydomonas_euryale.AAC.2